MSSSQPIFCVPERTHRAFRRTCRAIRRTQRAFSFKTVLSKQHSARFLISCRRQTKYNVTFSGQVRPRQGTEICNFGAPSPLEALHWIFCFFSNVYVQFSKTSPLTSGESSEKSSGENRVKSCHVCGCHGFFGPDILLRNIDLQSWQR